MSQFFASPHQVLYAISGVAAGTTVLLGFLWLHLRETARRARRDESPTGQFDATAVRDHSRPRHRYPLHAANDGTTALLPAVREEVRR